MSQSSLNEQQRGEVLGAIHRTIVSKFYDPQSTHVEWDTALQKHRPYILSADSDEEFEAKIAALLAELKTSHVGLYHSGLSRCTCKMALSAVYSALSVDDGSHWVFQDVHEGGPAADAGIRAGDTLIAVDGRPFSPPEHPLFALGSTVRIEVVTQNGNRAIYPVTIPYVKVKRNELPKVEPVPIVTSRNLTPRIGYVRIASYPGQIGIDVANDISRAVGRLGQIDRLIFDLRGNLGGGIGVLRVMSLLIPEQRVVGTYVNGAMKSVSRVPTGSFILDRIPTKRSELVPLAIRFFSKFLTYKLAKRKMPISVVTEGLGDRSFHGRVVLLVDRHTASANEMLIAFAREHRLATIVGEATPGRVLGGSKFRLPHGYWLAIPVGSYRTTNGDSIEGKPIQPDIGVPFDILSAREGRDLQLEAAVDAVNRL